MDIPDRPQTKMVCTRCGSDDVVADASARWSPTLGEWELSCVHDNTTCENCSCTCRVVEMTS